ncbi:hypothetical protein [Thalassovita gelatinovora]|nr:hypothetical protein [Thalassovita gelatinovora]
MKTQKRWMTSVITTSKSDLPVLPWARRKANNAALAPQTKRRSA